MLKGSALMCCRRHVSPRRSSQQCGRSFGESWNPLALCVQLESSVPFVLGGGDGRVVRVIRLGRGRGSEVLLSTGRSDRCLCRSLLDVVQGLSLG